LLCVNEPHLLIIAFERDRGRPRLRRDVAFS